MSVRDGGIPNGNGVAYDTLESSCEGNADTVAEKEGLCYDRTASNTLANPPWDAGPPDGAVAIRDVMGVMGQVGLDCSGPP